LKVSEVDGGQSLAARLNRLFADIRPEGRNGRTYTNEEVASAIKAADPAVRVGSAYLSALRTGAKRKPTTDVLAGLARFFGVPVEFFLDDKTAEQVDAEITLAKVVGNLGVKQLALRALELSPQGLVEIAKILEDVLAHDQRPQGPRDKGG
jgi:transcriptional regulator with XRE-family HTH domain